MHRDGKERVEFFLFGDGVQMPYERDGLTLLAPLNATLIKGAISQAIEYQKHPEAIGRPLNDCEATAPTVDPSNGTITLQFNKLSPYQKTAIDETVAWINQLTSTFGFKRTKTNTDRHGCFTELSLHDDAPVWARAEISIDFALDIDQDDNRVLSDHSQIKADGLIKHPKDGRKHLTLSGEWPLTLTGLGSARQRVENFVNKLREWNLELIVAEAQLSATTAAAPPSRPEKDANT